MLNLFSARELAAKCQKKVQKLQERYDKTARMREYQRGGWVLVKFPSDETGRYRKLSHPWHGPYRVISCDKPNITVQKVYKTQSGQIQVQVHQSRVTPYPTDLHVHVPPGYFWHGRKHFCPGNPPRWVKHLSSMEHPTDSSLSDMTTNPDSEPDRLSSVEVQDRGTTGRLDRRTGLQKQQQATGLQKQQQKVNEEPHTEGEKDTSPTTSGETSATWNSSDLAQGRSNNEVERMEKEVKSKQPSELGEPRGKERTRPRKKSSRRGTSRTIEPQSAGQHVQASDNSSGARSKYSLRSRVTPPDRWT